VLFEDTARSHLLIVQCKYDKLGTAVDEGEVNDFFNRHEKFADHDWVMRHGSSSAKEVFSDYGEKIASGFSASYYFFSTADASPRTHDLSNDCSKSYEKRIISVKCELYDFSKLKDYYIRSQSVELSGPKEVTIMLPEGRFFEKQQPYPTVVAVVKGNALRNLYQQHKESLYAWNIRGYLGNRGINQEIRETAESAPKHFFYFNNGVSAICTEYSLINKNELNVTDFQIINGAQTISSLNELPRRKQRGIKKENVYPLRRKRRGIEPTEIHSIVFGTTVRGLEGFTSAWQDILSEETSYREKEIW
jgi:hypothetical protein